MVVTAIILAATLSGSIGEASKVNEMLRVILCQISDAGNEITMKKTLRRWHLQ